MIYARIKVLDTTNITIVNALIDVLETEESITVDWSPNKLDIKLILSNEEQLLVVEELLDSLFSNVGVIQMDVSMDSEDKAIEQKFNYRYTIGSSSDSPEKQFLLKLFPAIYLIN